MKIRERLRTNKPARILIAGSAIFLLLAGLTATEIPLRFEIGIIHLYKSYVSPFSSAFFTCRFNPTCSSYALLVLDSDGFWLGNLKIAGRLLRCSAIGYAWDALTSKSGLDSGTPAPTVS